MRKIIFLYGAISGAVVIGSMILGLAFGGDGTGNLKVLEWLGYLIMLLALSIIFVGVKRHRDENLGGVIRFGTALLVGLGISAVAGVVYVAAWEVNLAVTDYAFINDYTESVIDEQRASGASVEELARTREAMEEMKERYAKPWYRLPITFLEIFPVGLIIALVSAAILRNPRVLPATG